MQLLATPKFGWIRVAGILSKQVFIIITSIPPVYVLLSKTMASNIPLLLDLPLTVSRFTDHTNPTV